MLKPIHIYTATAPSPSGSSQTYAVITRRERDHITLTGQVPDATLDTAALRAATAGLAAVKHLLPHPALRPITPITIHLPSETAALAANGAPVVPPTTPSQRRLLRLLARASARPNITFTDQPEESYSAINMACQHIAATTANLLDEPGPHLPAHRTTPQTPDESSPARHHTAALQPHPAVHS